MAMASSPAAFRSVARCFISMKHRWPEVCISLITIVAVLLTARDHPGLATASSFATALMLAAAMRWQHAEGEAGSWLPRGLLALCNILIAVLTYHWVVADGFIFTRDFGESFSVYLAAHNARDFFTFLLQDLSTDSLPVGHPFFYTHQPSFVARFNSLLLQTIGLGIPANMVVNFVVVTLLLWTMAKALSRHLPWPVVVGGTFFVVSNYALFHENIVDLSRAPGYFALFSGVAVIANDPPLRKRWSSIGVAATVVIAAATDFVVCVFVVYVVTTMQIWLSRGIRWRPLLFCVVMPCVGFYAVYFATVATAVGVNFFVTDMLFSYFGRAGQIVPRTLSSLGWIPRLPDNFPMIARLYQEANVVLWSQPPVKAFVVRTFLKSIAFSWEHQASVFVAAGMGAVSVASLLSTIAGSRRWRLVAAGSGALIALCWVGSFPLLILLPIPAAFLVIVPGVAIPRAILACVGPDSDSKRRAENTLVFTAIAAMGILVLASIFPDYGIRFIISERRGVPAPFLEMLSFGLIVYVAYLVTRWAFAARGVTRAERWPIGVLGIAVAAVAITLVAVTNVKEFRRSPPRPPSYARLLSQPEYAHEPFVTTSFYGQAWYFTHGWAYMVPNPPDKAFVDYWEVRHVRDWKNVEKYGQPHYFLCDNTQLKGYAIAFTAPAACSATGTCSCVDVANYMRERGYEPVVVRSDFAIVDVRNPEGLLHRAAAATNGKRTTLIPSASSSILANDRAIGAPAR
jgi:hypothetical protein